MHRHLAAHHRTPSAVRRVQGARRSIPRKRVPEYRLAGRDWLEPGHVSGNRCDHSPPSSLSHRRTSGTSHAPTTHTARTLTDQSMSWKIMARTVLRQAGPCSPSVPEGSHPSSGVRRCACPPPGRGAHPRPPTYRLPPMPWAPCGSRHPGPSIATSCGRAAPSAAICAPGKGVGASRGLGGS